MTCSAIFTAGAAGAPGRVQVSPVQPARLERRVGKHAGGGQGAAALRHPAQEPVPEEGARRHRDAVHGGGVANAQGRLEEGEFLSRHEEGERAGAR